MASPQASKYTLITTVESMSGSPPWRVSSDGDQLSCQCPKWRFAKAPKTCHHVEFVAHELADHGLTVARATEWAKRGVDVVTAPVVEDPITLAVRDLCSSPLIPSEAGIEAIVRRFAGQPTRPVHTPPTWIGRTIIFRD